MRTGCLGWLGLLPEPRPRARVALACVLAALPLVISSCHARSAANPPVGGPDERALPIAADGPAPLFVFAAIGDPHISKGQSPVYMYVKANDKSAELLANCVRDINAHVPRVDFVVLLGDITDRGSKAEFETVRKIADSLACPLYAVVGNHDNFESDAKSGWMKFAGRDSTNYAFDWLGFHFIVIDCTKNPYTQNGVDCDRAIRAWVTHDLIWNRSKHTILFSHYNMWERPWNPMFDTTGHYAEYDGMNEMRQVLERAGNVCAVVNGHVHANRVEVHNGIYYVDIGATLVGRPSIRYFYVFPDRIEVTYAYISDQGLLDYVVSLGERCTTCFDRKQVADFADGSVADKQFTIPLAPHSPIERPPTRSMPR
jgi:predicted phosphodiesterase